MREGAQAVREEGEGRRICPFRAPSFGHISPHHMFPLRHVAFTIAGSLPPSVSPSISFILLPLTAYAFPAVLLTRCLSILHIGFNTKAVIAFLPAMVYLLRLTRDSPQGPRRAPRFTPIHPAFP